MPPVHPNPISFLNSGFKDPASRTCLCSRLVPWHACALTRTGQLLDKWRSPGMYSQLHQLRVLHQIFTSLSLTQWITPCSWKSKIYFNRKFDTFSTSKNAWQVAACQWHSPGNSSVPQFLEGQAHNAKDKAMPTPSPGTCATLRHGCPSLFCVSKARNCLQETNCRTRVAGDTTELSQLIKTCRHSLFSQHGLPATLSGFHSGSGFVSPVLNN